jgi:hypothetical protein
MIKKIRAILRPFMAASILLALCLLPSPARGDEVQEAETTGQVNLPVGKDTYKIEIEHDGLYAINGAQLSAAGLDMAEVDPDELQMMQGGKSVAFQFVDKDGQPGFGSNDEIRFFGWAFDGSRYEDMYIGSNIFWLWAGDGGDRVQAVANETGKGYTKVSWFNESITKWPHLNYFPGLTVNWQASPNEATTWHWMRIRDLKNEPRFVDLPVVLPNPAVSTGSNGTVTVEFTSRYNALKYLPESYQASISLNGNNNNTTRSWEGGVNLNIEHQTTITQFLQPGDAGYPENIINLEYLAHTDDERLETVAYVTRATVDYPRELVAVNNELIFTQEAAGNHEFQIEGFSPAPSESYIVWDISDPYNPLQIEITSNQIFAGEAGETAVIGRSHDAYARFIATTTSNLRQVESLSRYVPASITPPEKAGTWVAISHKSLLPAAEELAAFRAKQSGFSTWVVDLQEIANQVGFGFNTPEAIRDYLRQALDDWREPPQYLVLFGDATVNPRGLDCQYGCGDWDPGKPTLVPTDLLFIDRFNGLIPVDYTYATLTGDDLIPELAVGRVTAETLAEAQAAVSKIKLYEASFETILPWTRNVLFIADDPDSGGNFCQESIKTASHLPAAIDKKFLCLPAETGTGPTLEESTEALRLELFKQINDDSLSILNFRGHGGVKGWASPNILNVEDDDLWQNVGRPPIIISADCLDGHFAEVWSEGLAETFFDLGNNRGTAAHWSSAGVGYAFEHTPLINAFYDALFKERVGTIGDAINQAKVSYLNKGYHESEAYSFTLLGDPAMVAYRWTDTGNLPFIIGGN